MMKKVWLATVGTFMAFVLVAIPCLLLLHLKVRDRWLLAIALLLLGILAAVLVYLYMAARARAGQATGRRDSPVDAAWAAARSRLGRVGKPRRLPAVLVLGPHGGAKSTIVAESGLQPELLAGEVRREGVVVPTDAVNIWYAQGTLFVEAGGGLPEDAAQWPKLVKHLRPSRLKAALSGKAQAPRLAVVCFPCDELVRPGAAQSAPAAAQALRERLLQVAQHLGIRLPVYVLFTRMDRIPHFTEFVRSLSSTEAQEVLGATLPAPPPLAAALYAEREAARITGAFHDLLRSLSLSRGDLLAREAEESVRLAAYELPRELRKASDAAIRFMVELTRPSHLGVSPFLRGFYFTGVRPIVVEDGTLAAPAPAPRPETGVDATSVFDVRSLRAQTAAAPATRGTRRVPEWVFLRRFFPEVVLADRAALLVTAGGTRVDGLRRAGLIAASLLCLIAAVGFTTSFVGNNRLENEAMAAVPPLRGIDATAPDALKRLDAARDVAARLRTYEVDGRPMHLRWGLYSGVSILEPLRRAYFHAFDQLLWRRTRTSMLASLRALPSEPDSTSAYGPTYDALKAHLVTTSHPEASTATFLAPVLMRFWSPEYNTGPDPATFARRQFEFFGSELPFGNPFPDQPDAAVVAQAQHYLQSFGDVPRLYASLIAEANERAPAIQFSRLVPGASPAVRNDVVVPGAFTKPGWAYVQSRLKDVNKLFERESWVVGPAAIAPEDRVRIAREMAAQYLTDYQGHWQTYLAGASIGGLGGPADAARTLARLSDNQSPLLQMLAIASTNTAVDTGVVKKAFQPVQAVVPPNATDKFVVEANTPYVKGLAGLQAAIGQAATAQGPAKQMAITQVATAADQANGAVLQLAQSFSVGAESRAAGDQVRRILQAPITGVSGLLSGMPSADLNGKGQSFCGQIGRALSHFPFNPRSPVDASMDEVSQLFAPNNNAFTAFYDAGASDVLAKQGAMYAPKIGATPQPSGAFVAFFNRAADISRSLYDADGTGPEVVFALRPQTSNDIPEVTVAIDGQSQTYTRTVAAAHTFAWDGARAQTARITARIRGTDVTLVQAQPGPWALFRLMQQADWERTAPGRYTLRWHLPQQNTDLAAEISFAKGSPVFQRDYLGGLRCVSEVAR